MHHTSQRNIALIILAIISILIINPVSRFSVQAKQNTSPPFSLPFSRPPGPQTWLIGQQYGNTATAYNLGKYWYRAGQGLHFGLDFATPCGSPILAIGDGIVDGIDNFVYGLLPHNVTIYHPDTGLVSLYGHLYIRSALAKGQPIKRGDLVGLSGDPDLTCLSRPHLHLEIRSRNYLTAYDPTPLIDADWPMLSSIGYYSFGGFTKDLRDPNRWQTVQDQPPIKFGKPMINGFDVTWPPEARVQPSPHTLPVHIAPPIPDGNPPTFRRLTRPGCCSLPWWSPDSRQIMYFDSQNGQLATVMRIGVDGGAPDVYEGIPPTLWSANALFRLQWWKGTAHVVRVTDNYQWNLSTGAWPSFSPANAWLMWQTLAADEIPGSVTPSSEIWVAKLDGNPPELVQKQAGGAAYWLDDDRLLLVTRVGQTNVFDLKLYTLSTNTTISLLTVANLRGLSVAPGGRYVMYYAPFQDNRKESGVYLLERTSGRTPVLMSFFGSWRWRDSNSIIYIPYEPGKPMSFVLYDVVTGQSRRLTDPAAQPFEIMNDDWSISPDGRYIVLWNEQDHALWLVTLTAQI